MKFYRVVNIGPQILNIRNDMLGDVVLVSAWGGQLGAKTFHVS
jgi:hypothetical protein